jgi:uncharacterized protein (DUF2062 family)
MVTNRWFKWWHKKEKRVRHSLRNTYVHRILGERIFQDRIWRIDLNSTAGALSLGLFVAFTPTIPFQMFLCAIGAILFRVNMPIALASCWITNPLTALPIYLSAYGLGQYLLEHIKIWNFTFELFSFESRTGVFMKQSLYLWTGSLVFSVVSAFLANIAARLAWRLFRKLKGKTIGRGTLKEL